MTKGNAELGPHNWLIVDTKKEKAIKPKTSGERDLLLKVGPGKEYLGGTIEFGTPPDSSIRINFTHPDTLAEAFKQLPKDLK
ncbi:MAG: hypothetical protein E6R05_02545 [Candidatus Moraniibacteriota bacterium]|nr:MAG: hypothetical protein E6R05_02545 [Candidatus Moranbacteria bacterium]